MEHRLWQPEYPTAEELSFFFYFFRAAPLAYEVPRLGVESEM